MRNRKQHGQIIRLGDRWYVRYWERLIALVGENDAGKSTLVGSIFAVL